MRISDWSSDVCSSDLHQVRPRGAQLCLAAQARRTDNRIRRQLRQRAETVGDKRIARILAAEESSECQALRSEEHTSELQSLMRISYAVFCLKKKKTQKKKHTLTTSSKQQT